jgi:hypothetical protein
MTEQLSEGEHEFVPAVDPAGLVDESDSEPVAADADVEAMALDDPKVLELAELVQKARAEGRKDDADALVAQNKLVYAGVLKELQQRQGTYKSPEDLESDRLDALAIIRSSLSGDETDEEVLRTYGLLDEKKVVNIESPLFRAETKQAFNQYMRLVTRFRAAADAEEYGAKIKDAPKVDRDRVEIHDDTATLVAEDLGIGFDSARSLVEKMRDLREPGSDEKSRYTMAIREMAHHLEDTGGHFGDISEPVKKSVHSLVERRHNKDSAEGVG